jgi:hypothetical protein
VAFFSIDVPGVFMNNSGLSNGTDGIILYGTITAQNSTTTLSVNSLPYVLSGTVSTVASSTLVIEAGTTIKGWGGFWGSKFNIYGNLLVQGTSVGDVVFTSYNSSPNKGDWQGVRLYANSFSDIKGAIISYAEKGIVYESSPLNLENVRFSNNNIGIQKDSNSIIQNVASSTVEFSGNTTDTSPAGLW